MVERVDFYILENGSSSRQHMVTCRLCEKAYDQGRRIYVHTTGHDLAQVLDDMLWTFKAGSFIPHSLSRDAHHDEPVQIGYQSAPPPVKDIILILGEQVPEFAHEFERIIEIVTDDTKTTARRHYREFQQHGYQIHTHQLQS